MFDVICARHVSKMSIRKEIFHKSKATPLEHVCYRFFMLPKEVHNTASKFNIRNALSEDDWGAMMHDAYALKLQGKVVHVRSYVQETKGSPAKQPFVMIIQDKWMLEMCIQSSCNNSWATDSTFKTKIGSVCHYMK